MGRLWTDEQLIEAVKVSNSVSDILTFLGLKPAGGNYKTIKESLIKNNISTAHFTRKGNGWSKGMKFPVRKLDHILVFGKRCSTHSLKLRLIKAGIKERRCEHCKLDTWLGNPIPIELHHIDGDYYNNLIENIELICPNCHALTDNYRGKNVGKQGH